MCIRDSVLLIVGDDQFYLKFWAQLTPSLPKRRFQSISARSASAVKYHSEISSIMTTTSFPVSLRWTAYAIKFLYVKTVSDKVVRYLAACLSVQKYLLVDTPFTWKFGRKRPTPFKHADFRQRLLQGVSMSHGWGVRVIFRMAPIFDRRSNFSRLKINHH